MVEKNGRGQTDSRRIGILIYPQAEVLDITGPHEVFSMALRQQQSARPYEVFLIARTEQPVTMSSGMELGLLDGKQVTTHWGYCQQLQKRYPRLEVMPDALYIRQDNIYTSAGITAGMDLALALVEEDEGKELAMSIARKLVLFYKRPGGQKQFSEFILSQSSSYFNELIDWIMQNLTADLSIEKLADRVNMSPRNFTRLFKKKLDDTPGKFIEKLRLRHARILLENKATALKEIAGQCGFRSEEQMRRAFLRELCVTPQEYRSRF